MSSLYRVVWEIDVEANTAREAAEMALAIQRDLEGNATVFAVQAVHLTRAGAFSLGEIETIDLSEP